MDNRLRGTLSTSAGFLFASFFFVLSVFSTLFHLLLPFHPTGANVSSQIQTRRPVIRRASTAGRRRSMMTTNSHMDSISSYASPSSSQESCSTTHSEHPSTTQPDMARQGTHGRIASECTERPDFRRTIHLRHHCRRSESTPPSPKPWTYSMCTQPAESEPLIATDGADLPRARSSESLPHSAPVKKRLSFLRRKKVHIADLTPDSPDAPVVLERRKSHLSFLHRRRSLNISTDSVKSRRSMTHEPNQHSLSSISPLSLDPDEDEEHHHDHEHHRDGRLSMSGRRSQTLRTQPYDAPYFFPVPGTVEAEHYTSPKRRPERRTSMFVPGDAPD
ncbi:hypothetical protein FB45DRAFT_963195 [Roridomyces roridus]|uniref:Uncharacterized protein n=1 Tax=Roridomyces roridus TaxID=1738132 RepID=A0AAD7F8K0_9AGAR|nr:hypothetical protein FB45DRAFT_963195 [Roridomyces roridus]